MVRTGRRLGSVNIAVSTPIVPAQNHAGAAVRRLIVRSTVVPVIANWSMPRAGSGERATANRPPAKPTTPNLSRLALLRRRFGAWGAAPRRTSTKLGE